MISMPSSVLYEGTSQLLLSSFFNLDIVLISKDLFLSIETILFSIHSCISLLGSKSSENNVCEISLLFT